MQTSLDAIQVMGGDGGMPPYPLEETMNVSKVENIAGGTMEACRLVIFRTGVRQMAEDFTMQRKTIHDKLGIPIPAAGKPERQKDIDEEKALNVLAEDYRVTPGLYMSIEDIKEYFDVSDEKLEKVLVSLEKKGLVNLAAQKKYSTCQGYIRWFEHGSSTRILSVIS
jgi:hypothetical protein